MNALMTYYTYFKDYKGDKAAGKITAVVFQGLKGSRITALLVSPLPSAALAILMWTGKIEAPTNNVFFFLFFVTLFLQVWTGVLYFLYPTGPKAYTSLVTNFRACTCGQVTLIALFNQELALYLYIASYVFIGFLFDLHRNRKA
jgi:geranylgeranylglycerol-phosphate geranylgeranyltransferase